MKSKIVLFAIVTSLFASYVFADEVEVQPITVTAGRVEQSLMEVPMSVGVVDSDAIKKNPKRTVAEQLADIPGVAVEDGSMAGGTRVSIRGEGSSRVLILIDGVKVSEQKSMSGASILIDPNEIERIEVIKGPASVLYGSEAIGGVVNIITKKGGTKPFGMSLSAVLDSSVDSFEPAASAFGNINGFIYRFSASGVNASDRKTPKGDVENTSYERRSYSGLLGYEWNEGSFFVKASRYTSEISIPDTDAKPAYLKMDLPKWDRDTISSSLIVKNISDNFVKLSVLPYYQKMQKDFYNNIRVAPGGPMVITTEIDTTNKQNSYGGVIQSEWLFFDSHYITLGLDYNKDDLDAKSNSSVRKTMPPPGSLSKKEYKYKASMDTIGVFIQDGWEINENWKLDIGARNTWVNSKLNETNDPIAKEDKESDTNLVMSAGVIFSLDKLAVRTHFSQGYRFPSINQLYIGTAHGGSMPTHPNTELKPEKSNNYELGLRYMSNKLTVDSAVYYADAKDYITTDVKAGRQEFVNLDKAKTYGLETYAAYSFDFGLTPYVSFDVIKRKLWHSDYSTSDAGVSPFSGKVGVRFEKNLMADLTLYSDLDFTWASTAKKSSKDMNSEKVETDTYHAWETLNLAFGVYGGVEHKYYANLGIRNILDRSYNRANSSLREAGVNVVLSLGYEF